MTISDLRVAGVAVTVALLSAVFFASFVQAETVSVTLNVRNEKSDEKVINRSNLLRIRDFILRQGKRGTYCNMCSNNPAFYTRKFSYFLTPGSDLEGKPPKSGYTGLTIRWHGENGNEYRGVVFGDVSHMRLGANRPDDDITVGQLRASVTVALKEILAVIDGKTDTATARRNPSKATDIKPAKKHAKPTPAKPTLSPPR